MKIWKLYSVGQSPKVAAHATEWRRVLGLARSIGAYRACVKMCKNLEIISDKKKRVRSRGMRTYTTYGGINVYKQKIPLERTTRLARSRSPIIDIFGGHALKAECCGFESHATQDSFFFLGEKELSLICLLCPAFLPCL